MLHARRRAVTRRQSSSCGSGPGVRRGASRRTREGERRGVTNELAMRPTGCSLSRRSRAASSIRQQVGYAAGGSSTKSLNRRTSVDRDTCTAAANSPTVHGARAGFLFRNGSDGVGTRDSQTAASRSVPLVSACNPDDAVMDSIGSVPVRHASAQPNVRKRDAGVSAARMEIHTGAGENERIVRALIPDNKLMRACSDRDVRPLIDEERDRSVFGDGPVPSGGCSRMISTMTLFFV
jgi:hypothetical protein